jgi:hypothetical protein
MEYIPTCIDSRCIGRSNRGVSRLSKSSRRM